MQLIGQLGGCMFKGMSNSDTAFLERISATAIVNQAIIKCGLAGMDVTHDNVIAFIGDFADPEDAEHLSLIAEISRTIDEVMCNAAFKWVDRKVRH